ncbi:SirB2 family protein [Nitrosomonas halophila]|uniref:Uncharacterized membrane protein SirB2 n=1 Tax=Nitrosomonas halophila TaxID=44576 RepID=A0A1H3FT70_9PROT|nr:SirB2 family protein [Nitrosomonas halophila]SDX94017.1 Uncharacterized membrane protein SirB2 [Nitrosomonas halophila]
MDYAILKLLHVTCVILSYLLFLSRGVWMLRASSALQQRWVKIMPHINDTVLLASAIALAMLTQRNPAEEPWLAAKIGGLLVYIALGMVAFRFAKTRRVKATTWILAQGVFIYIVLVAVTKNPVLV